MSAAIAAAGGSGSHGSFAAFAVSLSIGCVCAWIAGRKGRNQLGWCIFGCVFNLVALVVVVLLPRRRLPDRASDQAPPPVPLRHTRTVAFPEDPARTRPDKGVADEIERWLESRDS